MRRVIGRSAVLLTLGLAACGGEEPESEMSALEREARDACTGLGSTDDACDCFVDGIMETLTDEDADVFLRIFAAENGQGLEAIGDDPMAAALTLTRLMTDAVPIAARCEVELDFGIR